MSAAALAGEVEVDPKSVERWVRQCVVPRRTGMKLKVARVLGVDEADIWPATADTTIVEPGDASEEVTCAWSHRADVPKARWWDLFSRARLEKKDIELLS